MGPRDQAGNAVALCRAGAGGACQIGFPTDDLRSTGVSGDAGRRASARVSRQSAGMFELALDGEGRVLLRVRHCPDVYYRFEVISLKLTCARRFATPAVYRSSVTENATASSSQSCHTPSGSCDATVRVYSSGHNSQRKANATRIVSPAARGPSFSWSSSVFVP